VVQGADAHLDWDWGSGSPHASVNSDHLSGRWTRYIDMTAGTYRFTATSDDGIRSRLIAFGAVKWVPH
jgi:hypothetical protein